MLGRGKTRGLEQDDGRECNLGAYGGGEENRKNCVKCQPLIRSGGLRKEEKFYEPE